MLDIISATDLMTNVYPPHRFLVDDLIPEGLSVIGGAPKIGKSWFMLQLAIALANGQPFLNRPTGEPRRVLYLALEDPERRLQSRMHDQGHASMIGSNLDIATVAPRLDSGLLDPLAEWDDLSPLPGVALIDTYGLVKGPSRSGQATYEETLADLRPVKELIDSRDLSVILVHHARKGDGSGRTGGDPFDSLLGSTGIFATADTGLLLEVRNQVAPAALHVRGRDVGAQELALRFDKRAHIWVPVEESIESRLGLTLAQAEVYSLIANGHTETADIVTASGKQSSAISNHLKNLVSKGVIERKEHGAYDVVREREEDPS